MLLDVCKAETKRRRNALQISSVIAKNLPQTSFSAPIGRRFQFKSLFKLAITKTKNTARTYLPCFVWLGWRDLNSRMTESESVALPLGDTPIDFTRI